MLCAYFEMLHIRSVYISIPNEFNFHFKSCCCYRSIGLSNIKGLCTSFFVGIKRCDWKMSLSMEFCKNIVVMIEPNRNVVTTSRATWEMKFMKSFSW